MRVTLSFSALAMSLCLHHHQRPTFRACLPDQSRLLTMRTTVWSLRIRKVRALEAAGLTGIGGQQSIEASTVAKVSDSPRRRDGLSLASTVKACFAVIKV